MRTFPSMMSSTSAVDGKAQFSMLGLGDIVIPGIFVAIALRYDAAHSGGARAVRPRYFYRCVGNRECGRWRRACTLTCCFAAAATVAAKGGTVDSLADSCLSTATAARLLATRWAC